MYQNYASERYYRPEIWQVDRSGAYAVGPRWGAMAGLVRLWWRNCYDWHQATKRPYQKLRVLFQRNDYLCAIKTWAVQQRRGETGKPALSNLATDEVPLFKPQKQSFLPIRRKRDCRLRGMEQEFFIFRGMVIGEWLFAAIINRQDKQRSRIFPDQLPMGNDTAASQQQEIKPRNILSRKKIFRCPIIERIFNTLFYLIPADKVWLAYRKGNSPQKIARFNARIGNVA